MVLFWHLFDFKSNIDKYREATDEEVRAARRMRAHVASSVNRGHFHELDERIVERRMRRSPHRL